MPMAEYSAMIAKCRQATRRQSRLTWCTEVIAVSAVVTDTAVDIGGTKASIGMAISTAPNPAALRTANAPIITTMKKTRPSRDKADTLRISRPSGHLGQCSAPERRAATKFSRDCVPGLDSVGSTQHLATAGVPQRPLRRHEERL